MMMSYINNILPRIKQFSVTLERKEFIVDIPWVIIDEQKNQQKYIFRRNGDLIMSLNGNVSMGHWEYISAAKSLLIDRIKDKILLNQNFVDPAVMILNLDGHKEDYFILANELLIPDLDVSTYLQKLYYQKNNIATRKLKSGELLELVTFSGTTPGSTVAINGQPVSDCLVELAESDKKYVIKNSQIIKILINVTYITNRGKITIEIQEGFSPAVGDFAYQNEIAAPDGKYKLGFLSHVFVKDGRISKTSSF